MKILITGCAGFIGSNLLGYLLDNGHEVIGIDNYITGSQRNIQKFVTHKRFSFIQHDLYKVDLSIIPPVDLLFHLASPASPIQYQKYAIETMMVNSVGTKQLLDYLVKQPQAIMVYSSTSEVYGDPHIHPQTEGYWGNVNPNGVRSCYDEAKRFGEALCMTYVRKFNLHVRIARIFNTYGPNMEKNDGRVVSNFINQSIERKPITIYGDGSQTRSFCYVDDMVRGLFSLGTKHIQNGEVINLGNPTERTVSQLAALIQKMTETDSKIELKSLPSDDPKKRKPDISKAKKLLHWEPTISIEEGLLRTIAYFKNIKFAI